ncbi:MAG: PorV/PorQ family protein [bacterium]
MRKRRLTLSVVMLLTLWLLPSAAMAAGETGAIFLLVGVGARPEGMGGAFVAIADDANAVNINPAGITQIKGQQVTLMHNEYLLDFNHEYISYAQGMGQTAWGGSLVYLDFGEFPAYSTANVYIGSFRPNSYALTAAYGFKSTEAVSYGVNLKYIREKLIDTGTAFAVDAGVLITPPNVPWRVGAVLQNLGTKIKIGTESDPLPLTLRVGGAYKLLEYPLLLAGDVYFIRDSDPEFHFGAEYKLVDIVSLRLGYDSSAELDNGITFGVGFAQEGVALDYAFVPMGDFGDSHRFSISMNF